MNKLTFVFILIFLIAMISGCTNINEVPIESNNIKKSVESQEVEKYKDSENEDDDLKDDEREEESEDEKKEEINSTPTIKNNSTVEQKATISTSELAQHNTRDNCWVAFQGEVYDVTSFLPKHPGGINSISRYCGTADFESAFTKQHGTSKISLLKKSAVLKGNFN